MGVETPEESEERLLDDPAVEDLCEEGGVKMRSGCSSDKTRSEADTTEAKSGRAGRGAIFGRIGLGGFEEDAFLTR